MLPFEQTAVTSFVLRVRAARNHRSAGAAPAVVVDAVDECVAEALPDDVGAHDEVARELTLHSETEVDGARHPVGRIVEIFAALLEVDVANGKVAVVRIAGLQELAAEWRAARRETGRR